MPTTVFTPLEYGTIGMSEEDAIAKHGEDNIEVYIQYFKPLEWSTNHEEHNGKKCREDSACMIKLVCDLQDDERVLGLHYLGPNAAEVTQGYAVAMKLGATKGDFDRTVGIHPRPRGLHRRHYQAPGSTPRRRAAEVRAPAA